MRRERTNIFTLFFSPFLISSFIHFLFFPGTHTYLFVYISFRGNRACTYQVGVTERNSPNISDPSHVGYRSETAVAKGQAEPRQSGVLFKSVPASLRSFVFFPLRFWITVSDWYRLAFVVFVFLARPVLWCLTRPECSCSFVRFTCAQAKGAQG